MTPTSTIDAIDNSLQSDAKPVCKCDKRDWAGFSRIPKICKTFQADGMVFQRFCSKCGHEADCHETVRIVL